MTLNIALAEIGAFVEKRVGKRARQRVRKTIAEVQAGQRPTVPIAGGPLDSL
jgi:hypothetical protein